MKYNKAELHQAAKIDQLYTNLVREYNKDNWQAICSLDKFLQIKAESALIRGNGDLYSSMLEVIAVADKDY